MTMTLKPVSTASSDDDQRNALAAPVRDPLWLLARQWQTGGFIADDAGTPVHVTLAHTVTPLSRDGTALRAPLQPVIEAEPVPAIENVGTDVLVRFAIELLRRLHEAGVPVSAVADLRAAWTTAYPFSAVDPRSTLDVVARRLPNPVSLFHLLAPALTASGDGPFPTALDITAAGTASSAAQAGVRGWYAWLAPRVAAPGAATASSVDPPSWNRQRLEYAFAMTSRAESDNLTLRASDYDGLGPDWFSFDAETGAAAALDAASTTVEVHPTPVTYPGMPRPRFWEFEDGDVNLDALRDSDNPAQAVLAAFAHAYANDWFLIALPETDAGLAVVTALTVRDTFGTTTSVQAVADIDGGNGPWQLWELASASPLARGARLLLPTTPSPLEGPVIEDVLVARDEMANLAWVIELTTRDADGANVDRYRRYLALRPPDDPSYRPADQSGEQSYLLGTTVPDFWYPLVTTTGPRGEPLLELASLPPEATGVPDADVRGLLIAKTPGTTIADEEASRDGTRVIRRDRLVRTPTGVSVWRARAKETGLGEASSGLRFDVLQ